MTTNRIFGRARVITGLAMVLVACGDLDSEERTTTASNMVQAAPHTTCGILDGRRPLGDFNADAISDILWRNTQTGEVRAWLMDPANGTSCQSELVLTPPTPNPGWKIKGTGDFDGDGDADILWQNDISHTVVIWLMTGATHTGGSVDCGSAAWPDSEIADWEIAGTGHYDGDVKADILWQRVTGSQSDLVVWHVDGLTCTGTERTSGPASNWTSYGGGYFDNGYMTMVSGSDVLWRNETSCKIALWYMDHFEHISGNNPTPWDGSPCGSGEIVGVGRYDNDDYCSDILWRDNLTDLLYVWQMSGNMVTSIVPIQGCGTIAQEPDWIVVGPH